MIDAKGITKRYGDFVAVNNVSFQIDKGEIVGLLGHNGAGKTTIMKMITGYLEPSEGQVLIDGLNIEADPLAVQGKIGYLPENCPVYKDMNVVEYLMFMADIRGIPEQDQSRVIRETILRTKLKEKALSRISTLSKGYQQRVGVAQAIIHKPEILILDEPTNGLDPSQIHDMRALIRQLSQNSTVIISTHILQEVEAICDRVIIILNGKIALDSRLDALKQSNRLQVTVNRSKNELSKALNEIKSIQKISELSAEGELHSYLLELPKESNSELVAAISGAIASSGMSLYGLVPESRTLESVFREINAAS